MGKQEVTDRLEGKISGFVLHQAVFTAGKLQPLEAEAEPARATHTPLLTDTAPAKGNFLTYTTRELYPPNHP